MKAQTYHVGNGKRACKEHEGVTEKKTELEQKAIQTKEQEKKRAEERVTKKEASFDIQHNRCWACRRVAITEQEFWIKVLVVHERMKLKRVDINPFTPEYVENLKKELHIKEKLLVTTVFPVEGNEELVKKLPYNARSCGQIINMVSLCQDCATNVGFKKELPKVSIDELIKISAAYEVLVRPVFVEVAKGELKEEAEKN
jgi:hypothetical protein